MEKAVDFPQGNQEKDYCVYCAHPDGTMQSYEEKLAGWTDFVVKTQGLDRNAATATVKNMMAALPAWKDRQPKA